MGKSRKLVWTPNSHRRVRHSQFASSNPFQISILLAQPVQFGSENLVYPLDGHFNGEDDSALGHSLHFWLRTESQITGSWRAAEQIVGGVSITMFEYQRVRFAMENPIKSHEKSHGNPMKSPWLIQNKHRSPGATPECSHLGQWPSRRRLCWNPLDSMTRLSIQDYSCQHYIYYHIFISIHVYILLLLLLVLLLLLYIYACACTYVCVYIHISLHQSTMLFDSRAMGLYQFFTQTMEKYHPKGG